MWSLRSSIGILFIKKRLETGSLTLWQPTLSPDFNIGVGKPVPIPDSECSEEYKLLIMKREISSKYQMTLFPKEGNSNLQIFSNKENMFCMHCCMRR